MRDIKFRAWDKDKGVFVQDIDGVSLDGDVLDLEAGEGYIGSKERNIEIEQYTGLKDKNGKEIYEGDIIEIDWNDKRYPKHISKNPVAWNENDACWDLPEGGSPKSDANGHYKVIGNIHENPELLKK